MDGAICGFDARSRARLQTDDPVEGALAKINGGNPHQRAHTCLHSQVDSIYRRAGGGGGGELFGLDNKQHIICANAMRIKTACTNTRAYDTGTCECVCVCFLSRFE